MIRFADKNTSRDVKEMWQVCFSDTNEFIELYFSEKYKNRNTLIYFENERPVASLQMLPYFFTFCDREILISYISGACTLEDFRNKGYMSELLVKSFKVMQERNISISVLIPAEDRLYPYYSKYGYEKTFDYDNEIIPLKSIWEQANKDVDKAYSDFDDLFRNKDFCVQKTKNDFITIYKDAKLDKFPPKTNLSGMSRIVNAKQLLSIFASKYPDKSFILELNDNILIENNGIYKIDRGICRKIRTSKEVNFKLDINFLCRLLFGYHLNNIPNVISTNFESHTPVMNLMLE